MKRFTGVLLSLALLCASLTGCGNAAQSYQEYANAVIECAYHGETAHYSRMTGADAQAAQAVYEDEAAQIAELLCYHSTVDTAHISEETRAGFIAVAKELMRRMECTASQAIPEENGYRIAVNASTTDFMQVTMPELRRVYRVHFAERFYKAPADSEELFAAEAAWGERVMQIMTAYLDRSSVRDVQTFTVNVTADGNGRCRIAEESWKVLNTALIGADAE